MRRNRLRIQQQIIYPPLRSNSTWSAIFAATATSAFDAFGILRSADHVVTNPWQIADPAAPDQYHRVFLEVVPLAGDVGGHFNVVGEPYTSHFPKCGIRLFRRDCANLQADARLLGRTLLEFASTARERVSNGPQRRRLRLLPRPFPRVSYQLIKRRQRNLQLSSGQRTSCFSGSRAYANRRSVATAKP